MIKTIHRFFYAWLFLTKFPAPPLPKATKEDWGRIAPYFVLIGFILGFMLFYPAKLLTFYKMPVMFSSLLILFIWNMLTGGLHLDGLMDTFDGINCQDPARKLEAMKDSRVGAFGVMAGIFVILFKLVTLCTLLLNKEFLVLLIAVPFSRLIVVYAFTFLGSNNQASISSSLILAGVKKPKDLFVNLVFFTMGCILVMFTLNPHSAIFHPIAAFMFVILSFTLCIGWAHWLDNHFKGHTGDTFGALVEISEVTVLSLGVFFKDYFVM